MKISTALINDSPTLCLDVNDRLYKVLTVRDIMLKTELKNEIEKYQVPSDFNLNFLKMSGAYDFLHVVEDYIFSSIQQGKEESLETAALRSGTYTYTSPIFDCPLYYGAIQNSPEFWRKNKRERIDLMFINGFARSLGARTGHLNMINIPEDTTSFRCATELGVVIGKDGKNISEEDAMDHVFGYTCVNDMIGNCWKDFAKEQHPDKNPSRFELLVNSYYGRCTENFGPVGPHIVTKDHVPDPYNLIKLTKLSGKIKDRAFTNAMLIGIERGIHLLSQFVPLKAGSIIHMGTMGRDGITINDYEPLSKMDSIEIEIEKVGVLRNHFRDHRFENEDENQ